MTRLVAAAGIAVLMGVGAEAQSTLTGKFQGTTPNGAQLVLDLTATDTAVSGTLTREGETVKIADGKVKEKTFTFKATLGDQAEAFSGELAGNDIKVWLDRRGPDSAITLTRVKK
jgi:hypothetical protein